MEPATSAYVQAVLVLLLLLGIILLAGWAARRFGLSGAAAGLRRGGGHERRLQVRETLALDPRRRLVLVARDGVEHLLLVGGPGGDVVVERAIDRPRFSVPAPPAEPPTQPPAAPSAEPPTHPDQKDERP